MSEIPKPRNTIPYPYASDKVNVTDGPVNRDKTKRNQRKTGRKSKPRHQLRSVNYSNHLINRHGFKLNKQKVNKEFRKMPSRRKTIRKKARYHLWRAKKTRPHNSLHWSRSGMTEKHVLFVLNPNAGTGKTVEVFQNEVSPVLDEKRIKYEVVQTTGAKHGFTIGRTIKLDEVSEICIVSGDGIIHEVVNGLLNHDSYEEAIRVPISLYPGGSGNGVLSTILRKDGNSLRSNEVFQSKCLECIGSDRSLDFPLMFVETKSFCAASIMTLSWGYIADCDIESEKFRFLGSGRFLLQALLRLCWLRKYAARISFLRAPGVKFDTPKTQKVHPTVSPTVENDFTNATFPRNPYQDRLRSYATAPLPDLDQSIPPGWEQVEGKFVMAFASNVSHLSRDMAIIPDREYGKMKDWFFLIMFHEDMSRLSFVKFLASLENEDVPDFDSDIMEAIPVKAFRLEPLDSQPAKLCIDGELIPVTETFQCCTTSLKANFRLPAGHSA